MRTIRIRHSPIVAVGWWKDFVYGRVRALLWDWFYGKIPMLRRIVEKRIGYLYPDMLNSAGKPAETGKLGSVEARAIQGYIEYRGRKENWEDLTTIRIIERTIGYWGHDILGSAEGNAFISQILKYGEPAAIGKLGSAEKIAIESFIKHEGRIERWDESIKVALYRNAGVFPLDDEVFYGFCLEFMESLRSLDFVAVWCSPHESKMIKNFAANAQLAALNALEPYFHKDPWSRFLENRKVLVIHPFAESIKRQFLYRDKIWQDKTCLPNFELDTIRSPLSDALVKSGFKDWFEALHHMKTEISEKEFDVAIVGAGAYSIPLVSHVKKKGKFAIHLGGTTQILFGIKGRRWDKYEAWSRFYNSYWHRPLEEETPPNASTIEGGCYW